MAGSLGTHKKFDVDLNIVPFIDLMSCLTAFLLVTAAWTDTAALDIKPKGRSRDMPQCMDDPEICEPITMSILVGSDAVWLGVSRVNDIEKIANTTSGPDWAQVKERLAAHKASTIFADSEIAEVAVESTAANKLTYQTMIAAMENATAAGFGDIGITEPEGLTTKPRL
jgi:biopolymer transport protein TolR